MFRDILNDKIGNLIAYLATEIQPLSLTKLLKLLFIIDERAMLKSGAPITWLEYKAWGEGPVARDIYDEVKFDIKTVIGNKSLSLNEFISVTKEFNANRNQEEVNLLPKKYSLAEFSRFEKELISGVIAEYGKLPAARLIELLHSKDSLWNKTVVRNNLQYDFAAYGKKSDVTIHLGELIQEDDFLLMASKSAFESLRFQEHLS